VTADADALVKAGKVARGSEADLVRSQIGLAVKAGAPVPDISNVEGLKTTIQLFQEMSGAKGPPPSPAKYVDQSYLKEALKELGAK